jgi:tetratricopeptide (TPR) repeat protein
LLSAGGIGLAQPFAHAFGFEDPQLSAGDFHLHPHYRAQLPLDATLPKTQAGLDDFVTEKYHDQIALLLREWSKSLLGSSQDTRAVERVLASDFLGTSFKPVKSRLVRTGPVIEIHQNKFAREPVLERDAFLREMRSAMGAFSALIVAEFQVTSIETGSAILSPTQLPSRLWTGVRYELVGPAQGFHREQRVGQWELEWEASAAGEYRLRRWQLHDETQSHSANPVFSDITAQAFTANPSYSSQMLKATDYWRTVLDVACGIDIYGHNGVSVGDIDNDGRDDLYICQPAGLPNRLYRNNGDGTFEDITEASGLGILENTACALFADFDNDGRQDLIVVRTSGPLLFLNQGDGKFRQRTDAFRFATPPQGTFMGAAVADYDRDGWLDIYFCLYLYYQGTDQYKYPSPYFDAENGPRNFLMRNNRDGSFRDVTVETGLDRNNTRYSFCCGWNDYNRDGWPDLYVVNDFGRKNLYRNNGDGTFTDVAQQAGVEDVGAGMGVCWFDYDNDGAEDLYVADMWSAAGLRITTQEIFQKDAPEQVRALYRKHAMGNSLFRNDGDGTFQSVGGTAGVEMGRWSWSCDAWDFDHDGCPDLYITNGMISGTSHEDLNSFFWRQVIANSPVEAKPSETYEQGWNVVNELIRSDRTWSGHERNVFYANNGDGTFSDASGVVGMDFVEDSRTFALADFDHDGRLEVLLKNRTGPQLRLLKNTVPNLGPSISFRLRGDKSNRDAIGAAITVEAGSLRQTRMLQAGSGFIAQHTKDVFFGMGEAKGQVQASIRWPSGLVQKFKDLPLNHRIWVEEGRDPSRIEPFKPQSTRQTVASVQEPAPMPTTVETWLLVPVTTPNFSLPDFKEEPQTLAAFQGKAVLLYFWVASSAACLEDLLVFKRLYTAWASPRSIDHALQLLTVNFDDPANVNRARLLAKEHQLPFPILQGSDDVAGIYNILYRHLFDRHRDLPLPAAFLIDDQGGIVKIYQGPINAQQLEQDFRQLPRTAEERLAKALPIPGVIDTFEFRRNHLSSGSVYYQRGYMDQAEASFQLALRDNPSSAEALFGLGSVYLKEDKTNESRASFERATRVQANYPDTLANAWNNLGLIATREGNIAEAIPYFQAALKLNPDHLIALSNLGDAYRQQKNWDESRKVLEHAVALSPEDPEVLLSLGTLYGQINDTKQAFEYLHKALKYRPDYPETLNNLGVLYLRTQRRDEAVANFAECIRVAPAFAQCSLNLAKIYAGEGETDKARGVLLNLRKQQSGHAQAQKQLDQLPQ